MTKEVTDSAVAATTSMATISSSVPPSESHEGDRTDLMLWTYQIVLPVISSLGLLGNILSVVVLSRTNKFKSVMYIYLRGVAWADMCYLVFALQVCYFVTNHAQGADIDGPAKDGADGEPYVSHNPEWLEVYMVNVMPTILNTFGTCSSVIVVFLTLNRFGISKDLRSKSNYVIFLKVSHCSARAPCPGA